MSAAEKNNSTSTGAVSEGSSAGAVSVPASEVANKRDRRWAFWMELCGRTIRCHQMPSRSFFIGSYQFPLCARCTGIMAGRVIALLLFPVFYFLLDIPLLPALIVLPILLVPLAVDGLVQKFTSYESTNFRRMATGILWGFAEMTLILMGITFLLKKMF
ncbi:MAG: DUF2085 domain-containing protein [Clostridiales bacterium]|nr:DUF2085 domain-containing protein [Clostridiales bacterium]